MPDYKVVHGTKVQNFASDPPAPFTGQVWYNSTSATSKYFFVDPGSWATGGTMNTARRTFAGAGTKTSALASGGGQPTVAKTESYNGTSWTEVNDLNQARLRLTGCGADNTAALAVSGEVAPGVSAINEIWNGTNWTEVNNVNTARQDATAEGTSTAALFFGGGLPPGDGTIYNSTEVWNGTNWTEVNNLNTARNKPSGSGLSTAALCFGGKTNAATAINELWNGTNWTEVNDLNTARENAAGCGTNTAALMFGGYSSTALTGATELWNGTNWTNKTDLSTPRQYLGGTGTSTSALAFGGTPPQTAATEEWNAGPTTNTLGSA